MDVHLLDVADQEDHGTHSLQQRNACLRPRNGVQKERHDLADDGEVWIAWLQIRYY